jgi:hypothetical protein
MWRYTRGLLLPLCAAVLASAAGAQNLPSPLSPPNAAAPEERLDFRLEPSLLAREPGLPEPHEPLSYRSAGEFALRDSVALEFGKSGFGERGGPLGSASVTPASLAPSGAARANALDLYDASLRWDALRFNPVTVSLHSGVRAMSYDARFDSPASIRERSGLSAAPVVGLGARWEVFDAVSIAGRGSWTMIGERNDARYAGLGAELAFDLSALSRFSVGFERLRADLSDGVIAARLERDLVFARFRFKF